MVAKYLHNKKIITIFKELHIIRITALKNIYIYIYIYIYILSILSKYKSFTKFSIFTLLSSRMYLVKFERKLLATFHLEDREKMRLIFKPSHL